MAKVLITESILQDTADAIREKGGTVALMTPSKFAENIDNIEIGADLDDYYTTSIGGGSQSSSGILQSIKSIPSNLQCSTNMSYAFYNCKQLTTVPQLDTSNVTNMSNMFSFCEKLTSVAPLDTSSATNMSSMFYRCLVLKTIPQLDTSSATDLSGLFAMCQQLTTIPQQLNTSNVTNMNNMFNNCRALRSFPQMDTSNVTSMTMMFSYCQYTTIPQMNTSKVTNMSNMFDNAKSLNIPVLDTSSVTNMSNMFYNCQYMSDDTLNNVLQMCINATSYTGTKTLAALGFASNYYSASRIQGLTKYQDFINAGWTIGY